MSYILAKANVNKEKNALNFSIAVNGEFHDFIAEFDEGNKIIMIDRNGELTALLLEPRRIRRLIALLSRLYHNKAVELPFDLDAELT